MWPAPSRPVALTCHSPLASGPPALLSGPLYHRAIFDVDRNLRRMQQRVLNRTIVHSLLHASAMFGVKEHRQSHFDFDILEGSRIRHLLAVARTRVPSLARPFFRKHWAA